MGGGKYNLDKIVYNGDKSLTFVAVNICTQRFRYGFFQRFRTD